MSTTGSGTGMQEQLDATLKFTSSARESRVKETDRQRRDERADCCEGQEDKRTHRRTECSPAGRGS